MAGLSNKILGYYPTYSDVKALEYTMPRNIKFGLDHILGIDGPFPGFKLRHPYSTDGTEELFQNYGCTLLMPGVMEEYQKFQFAMNWARYHKYNYVLLLGSDEWLEGDINIIKEQLDKHEDGLAKIFDLEVIEHTSNKWNSGWKRVWKIFSHPDKIKSDLVHWGYYLNGSKIPYQIEGTLLKGAVLHHDDGIRDVQRNRLMTEYQDWNVPREREILKRIAKRDKSGFALQRMLLEHDFPPTIGLDGTKYYSCGCIESKTGYYNTLCIRHERGIRR